MDQDVSGGIYTQKGLLGAKCRLQAQPEGPGLMGKGPIGRR